MEKINKSARFGIEALKVDTELQQFLITKANLLDENDNVIAIGRCTICV